MVSEQIFRLSTGNFSGSVPETMLLSNVYGASPSKWKSLKNRRLQNWGGVVHEKGLLPQNCKLENKCNLLHFPNVGVGNPAALWDTIDSLQLLSASLANKDYRKICEESGLFPSAINHVLINEYLPDQGIMPRQDGPAYFPVVAILSLGSPVVMNFTPHSRFRLCTDHDKDNDTSGGTSGVGKDKWLHGHHPFSILLMPRSLLIFKDEAVNEIEALKHSAEDLARLGSEGGVEEIRKDLKTIHRTTTRISLTCRSVLKVHKKLFKF